MTAPPRLWHIRETSTNVGDVIQPGRWGAMILAAGATHPHFFREHLLELYRTTTGNGPVSRLTCAYAWESREFAVREAAETGATCHEVVPDAPDAPASRHDVLWVTWLGEPRRTFDAVRGWLDGYWTGRSTEDIAAHAHAQWEWLIASPLRVIGHATT